MALPTLADFKAHINNSGTADDAELQGMLDRAVATLEKRLGPLGSTTVTETHYGLSSDLLVLRKVPAAALTAVSSRVGASTTALTLADYELDPASGLVRLTDGTGFYGAYTVTYTAGYAVLPADLELAVLELARHLWESQRPPGAIAPPGSFEDESARPVGAYLLPYRVQSLIEPYLSVALA